MKCYSDTFMSEKNQFSPASVILLILQVYQNFIPNINLIRRTDGRNLITLKQRNDLWTPESARDKRKVAFMALC